MNETLRQARRKAGKSQEQIAKEAGISTISYQRIEYGTQGPGVDIALRIARALNSTVEELFDTNK